MIIKSDIDSNNMYMDIANICEAYTLFYDKNPDFNNTENYERLTTEIQVMVYLLECCSKIELNIHKFLTNFEHIGLYGCIGSRPISAKLQELIEFLKDNPEYVINDMCTLDEDKKRSIKRIGRLVCIKISKLPNPKLQLEHLEYIAHHYFVEYYYQPKFHDIDKVSEIYERGSFEQMLYELELENEKELPIDTADFDSLPIFMTDDCISTKPKIDNYIAHPEVYRYMLENEKIRKKICYVGPDPFIKYILYDPNPIKWDDEYKQLEAEEAAYTRDKSIQNRI